LLTPPTTKPQSKKFSWAPKGHNLLEREKSRKKPRLRREIPGKVWVPGGGGKVVFKNVREKKNPMGSNI